MFLDDSACNLASFNLLKFLTPGGQFDIAAYRYAIAIVTTAMEIIVDAAGYPTEMIARNSHDYRPLGLGYANLGALLMAFGLPYDSDAGRDFAATLTSILCGDAYWQSARIAETCAPLGSATPPSPSSPRSPAAPAPASMSTASHSSTSSACTAPRSTTSAAKKESHSEARARQRVRIEGLLAVPSSTSSSPPAATLGRRPRPRRKHGFRNSQVTVLAPTGTIGFMMDCDTTGIEPDLALVKYKKLVGGGMIKIVNNTVPAALFKLGYTSDQVNAIVSYIDATGTIEGAPAHQARAPRRLRLLLQARQGHALHPLHGPHQDDGRDPALPLRRHLQDHQPARRTAPSKTSPRPTSQAWRLGIKAVAIYRDSSKGAQPLNVQAPDRRRSQGHTRRRRQRARQSERTF